MSTYSEEIPKKILTDSFERVKNKLGLSDEEFNSKMQQVYGNMSNEEIMNALFEQVFDQIASPKKTLLGRLKAFFSFSNLKNRIMTVF